MLIGTLFSHKAELKFLTHFKILTFRMAAQSSRMSISLSIYTIYGLEHSQRKLQLYNFYNFYFVNYCTFQTTLQELGNDESPALVTNLIHIINRYDFN